ncbi:IclR family transcriptional regulator [Saccharopolyspora rhizosphaerae]|uniref:IclR family transcriptional regulator n=1 Tax=Saccharopolyspora rhizosphaerae TaxID=2492662 RepID=A0A426JYS1_9PSEU|nr:IclR family transcriptional regulator [Saccharopolyspora rhizosphaerae]RRO18309.1 IclR family transcriptional regulator [Saccharopolyspora rhizosphaerae]
MTEQRRSGTQSVDRAMAVLRCFEKAEQLTPTAVATQLGLTVSTAHRIMRALHAADMLAQDPATERYFLGATAAILGRLALERMGTTVMHPVLTALRDRTGEAVSLGTRVGDEVAVLVQLPSPHPLRYDQEPGARNPIHVCAMGKALLAFGTEPVTMPEPFERHTPKTLTTHAELADELARIRSRGCALNDEERLVGVRAVAAPVHDQTGHVIAAVAVQGPTVRFGDDRVDELAAAVTGTARELSSLYRTGGG